MQDQTPPMQHVVSSNLSAVGYKRETQTLYVEFNGGGLYRYDDVPEQVYIQLMSAGSHGSFFARNIKNRYSTTKLR